MYHGGRRLPKAESIVSRICTGTARRARMFSVLPRTVGSASNSGDAENCYGNPVSPTPGRVYVVHDPKDDQVSLRGNRRLPHRELNEAIKRGSSANYLFNKF